MVRASLLVLLVCATASADVLFEVPKNRVVGNDLVGVQADADSFVAAGFVFVGADPTIEHVTFWGWPHTGDEAFTFQVRPAVYNGPNEALVPSIDIPWYSFFSGLTVTEDPCVPGLFEYDADLMFPITLDYDTPYYLQLTQGTSTEWYWHTSYGYAAAEIVDGAWTLEPFAAGGDTSPASQYGFAAGVSPAFRLEGVFAPEPATIGLLALGAPLALRRRKR